MGFKLMTNQSDLKRITSKLQKIVDNIQDPKGFVLRYKVQLLNEYKQAVAGAMGSVDASGGYATLEMSIGSMGSYWHALSPFTQEYKAWTGASMSIWMATGETKSAVKVWETEGFAGIKESDNADAFQKALNVEYGGELGGLDSFGGEWPKRALFTIANVIVTQHRDDIVLEIRKRIRHTIQQSGWGS